METRQSRLVAGFQSRQCRENAEGEMRKWNLALRRMPTVFAFTASFLVRPG